MYCLFLRSKNSFKKIFFTPSDFVIHWFDWKSYMFTDSFEKGLQDICRLYPPSFDFLANTLMTNTDLF